MGREALQTALGLSDRKSFRERCLKPALAVGLIEMTIPDKPSSRLQQYCLTDKGRHWLATNPDSTMDPTRSWHSQRRHRKKGQ